MTSPTPLFFVSYNVHAGFDADFCFDPHRIARVLTGLPWHVAFLQEVDVLTDRSRNTDLAQLWATLTGSTAVFERAMTYEGGDYGIAMLSRLPVLDTRRIELAIDGAMEPRLALAVQVQTASGPLWTVNVHLGLDDDERQKQFPLLTHALKELEGPVVLGGDFNTGSNTESLALTETGFLEADNQSPTFPSPDPAERIDRFFIRGDIEPRACGIADLDPPASDHLPLVLMTNYSTGTTGAG